MIDWHRIKTFFFSYGEEGNSRLDSTLWDYVNSYFGKVLNFIILWIFDPCYQFVESLNLPFPTLVVLFVCWSIIVLLLTFIFEKTVGRWLRKKKKKKKKKKIAERPTVIIVGADNKQSLSLYELLISGEKSKVKRNLRQESEREFPLSLASIKEITDLKKEMVEKTFHAVYLPFQKKSSIAQFADVVDYVIIVTNKTAQMAYRRNSKKIVTRKRSKKNSRMEKKSFDLMKTVFENKKLRARQPKLLVVSIDNENKATSKMVQQVIKRKLPNSPPFDVTISSLQRDSIKQVLYYLLGIH
ncbi:hypothetical protein M0813_13639 [Anaeramoeba flamelloides]|uniref:Uncharacterized protein n=1 Tax=Anaeramoeba flamelloides TaxID=1746091 RepID=A0ABQ8Z7S3_9EUKA|nr:hypothetical protein M0813_13639 [Anaeramoeba flamelloides]